MDELANLEYESLLNEIKDLIHQKQFQVLRQIKYGKYGEAFLEKVIEFNKEHGKTDASESLGAVEFFSLDQDVLQDYEGNAGKSLL